MNRTGRTRRWAAAVAGVTLATAALVACGDGGPSDEKSSGKAAEPSHTTSGKPSRPAFDPPVRFDGPTVELSSADQPSTTTGGASGPAVKLVDGVAYITAEEGMEAIDTGTGALRWEVNTKHPAAKGGFGSKRAAPLVSADGKTVYAAWNRDVKGQGTAPDSTLIEVLAIETNTGKTAWSAEIAAAPSATGLGARSIGADEILAPQIIGVDAGTALVTAADTTYAVEPSAGTVRWKKPGFRAVTLADGVVAGGEEKGRYDGRLLGLATATGEQRWTLEDARRPAAAAPRLLSATVKDKTLLVDAVSGEQRVALDGGGWRCRYDAQALVLCSRGEGYALSPRWITVFDASSLQKRWALPDGSGRKVPVVMGFWHGAVYANVGSESIVLDGATGQDRQTSAGAAPDEIDRYGGLEGSKFHPAAG
ncbi:outer membrane protein assembly factor BamB family protein [Streptomyces sp. JL7001]|uniref:outer membrane protein assembly factor BamB family protein n=1 Tax=Streptomyces sp. JL7001 TaxID=3445784 RepID=UPI003F797AE5